MFKYLEKSLKENLLISFKMKGRKEIIRGFVLGYNDEWILLKNNPVDFIIDGYKLLKTTYIKNYKLDKDEYFFSKVLKLKELTPKEKEKKFLEKNIEYFLKKFLIIQFEFKDETKCSVGKIIKFEKNKFKFKYLDPFGKWERKDELIDINKIYIFEVDTDYINSLLLVNNNLKLIK